MTKAVSMQLRFEWLFNLLRGIATLLIEENMEHSRGCICWNRSMCMETL